jgi:ABC-type lipoprotein release transport system permease subunit
MTTILKIAWRNIWRNRRRALITIASVFFAVFFCTVLNSFVRGLWEKMRDDVLRTQAGHIQIHLKGYWQDKIIDNFMEMEEDLIAKLEVLDNIENLSPRIQIVAMASNGTQSKGVAVLAISPKKEKEKSNLPVRLVKGDYLCETDDGILIGEGLANYLNVDVGDTIVFIGQGYQGSNAAGLFPVRGLLHLPTIEMNNGIAYTTLPAAQTFIDMPNGYSGLLISIIKDKQLNETLKACEEVVNEVIPDKYEVLPWTVTMQDLLKTAQSHEGMVRMVMFILYLIVGFGILGTVIMLTNERKREFSMMISLGMTRRCLKIITLLELTLLTLTGVLLSFALTVPVTFYFAYNPIQFTGDMAKAYEELGMQAEMFTTVKASIFMSQALTILAFAAVTFIYPMRKIRKMKITKNNY